MTVNEKIASVRALMAKNQISACIIPSADPHMSEYFSEHWKTRDFVSGFSGSAGTFVITDSMSGLWTDGRYYVQAATELSDTEAILFKAAEPDCPSFSSYVLDHTAPNSTVGVNGLLFSADGMKEMQKLFDQKSIKIRTDIDYANDIWEDRPQEELTEVFSLDVAFAGKTAAEKLADLRAVLQEKKADSIVISKLDCIAWLFNIRANDVLCNPVVISYAYVSKDKAILFADKSRIPQSVLDVLQENGVCVQSYEEIFSYLAAIREKQTVLCDEKELNCTLYRTAAENAALTTINADDPVVLLKACKNEVENKNTYNAYLKDGCVLAEFYGWLFEELEKGTTLHEYELVGVLESMRAKQPLNKGESFPAIIAYRENAAMMHYDPKEVGSKQLERSHLLLIDNGGQYYDGTTDITRTFALGPINELERKDFTMSLKGVIALSTAVFKEGMSGAHLDILCREPLWKLGLDYRCGTGHGVGFMLNVHEGPQSFSARATGQAFKEGMTCTIEPGVYREGEHGIRTENVVEVVKAMKTEYGQFYQFKTFTLVPIDIDCMDTALLSNEEIDWINDYHATVYEKVSPLVSERARKWLEKKTVKITK